MSGELEQLYNELKQQVYVEHDKILFENGFKPVTDEGFKLIVNYVFRNNIEKIEKILSKNGLLERFKEEEKKLDKNKIANKLNLLLNFSSGFTGGNSKDIYDFDI